MKGMTAFSCISDVDLDLIEEAAAVFSDHGMTVTPARGRRSGFSLFFSSGWGVAVICAVVSLSALGWIVWMGQRPAVDPPHGETAESESVETVYESESEQMTAEVTAEVTVEETEGDETAPEEPTETVSEPVTEAVSEDITEPVTEGVFHPDTVESGVLFISNGDGTCTVKGADKTYEGAITVPEQSPYGDVVTVVAVAAFKNFKSLTAVALPETVTVIKGSAFQGCSVLKRVTLPSEVTEFGRSMFDMCGELESVVLPAGLTEIPSMTFQTCVSLKSVVAKDGVTAIGANAFNGCRSMATLTLPAGLTSVGQSAFQNCCGLRTVYYGGSRAEWERVEVNPTNNAYIVYVDVVFDN